jgi:hypothetical protein
MNDKRGKRLAAFAIRARKEKMCLCLFMGKMAMHVEVCSDFASATRKLCHSKFEALVVDFKEKAAALELLHKSRQMTSHVAAVVLAILNSNDEMPGGFRASDDHWSC